MIAQCKRCADALDDREPADRNGFHLSKTTDRWAITGDFDDLGGDSFASGLIYGFLNDKGPEWAVNCGCAHGALAMTTPGDTTMATFDEVQRIMKGGGARVQR